MNTVLGVVSWCFYLSVILLQSSYAKLFRWMLSSLKILSVGRTSVNTTQCFYKNIFTFFVLFKKKSRSKYFLVNIWEYFIFKPNNWCCRVWKYVDANTNNHFLNILQASSFLDNLLFTQIFSLHLSLFEEISTKSGYLLLVRNL